MAKKAKRQAKRKAVLHRFGRRLISSSAKARGFGGLGSKIEREPIKKTRIRVIGIGGGGGAIVSEIASRIPRVSFFAINTDSQALKIANRKVSRLQIGQNLTQGLGTGMNPELGQAAAEADKEKIKKVLEGQDLCILVACLGGGTASGALPVIAKLSKKVGNITFGIFTFPFAFEGEKKMEIAKDSLARAKNHLNAIALIPNERVFQIIDKSTPLKEALSVVNKNLTEGLSGLIDTIYKPGLINIDFADFRTILEARGRLAFLNTVEVQRKEETAKDMVSQVLTSPLYPYTIKGAKGVLFNITGEKKLSLAEVSQISRAISSLVNPAAKIIFGISQSPQCLNSVKTTLLATGCGMKLFPPKPRKKARRAIKKELEEEPVVKKEIKKPVRKKPVVKKRKAVKPKAKKKRKKKVVVKPKAQVLLPAEQAAVVTGGGGKVRKNALQIKKEAEEIEKEMLEEEKLWETPAFLRKKPEQG